MKYATIAAALRDHLTRWPLLPDDVIWEGFPSDGDTPDPGTGENRMYLSEQFSPQTGDPSSIGPRPTIRMEGLYLLDVYVPSNQGIGEADALADNLLAYFCPRTEITRDGIEVGIRSATRTTAMRPRAGWLQVPLTISWWAHTVNPL